MNITIRNIPDEVIEKIRVISKKERRSLNSEILMLLENSVRQKMSDIINENRTIPRDIQIEMWKRLLNSWEDDRTTEEIIKDIHQHRTLGREVEL